MKHFSTREYIQIAKANAYGLDKLSWEERLEREPTLEVDDAKEPFQFMKAERALYEYDHEIPSGYIMSLDATNSVLQIMAVLTGCTSTAELCNLIGDERKDAYGYVADLMGLSRDDLKDPVMTHYYGSVKVPLETLGEEKLNQFYQILRQVFTGPEEFLGISLELWNSNALEHSWTLPDGHRAVCKVMVSESRKFPMIGGQNMGFVTKVNKAKKNDVSLAANIIHSIDGYIAREMVRRCHEKEIDILLIHDCFYGRPQHMNFIRECYLNIMIELARSTIYSQIVQEISGNRHWFYKKIDRDLYRKMATAEYGIC